MMSLLSHTVDKNKLSQLLIRFSRSTMTEAASFLPRKALVLRKFSRLEYERLCHPNLSEEQLALNVSFQQSKC